MQLPDREHALAYAKEIARELMQGREAQTRCWRLDIYENGGDYENGGKRLFELPFAAFDHTLDHLAPKLRSTVERLCDSYRSLQEVLHAARLTVREARALIARSRDKPYLAAVAGKHTVMVNWRLWRPGGALPPPRTKMQRVGNPTL